MPPAFRSHRLTRLISTRFLSLAIFLLPLTILNPFTTFPAMLNLFTPLFPIPMLSFRCGRLAFTRSPHLPVPAITATTTTPPAPKPRTPSAAMPPLLSLARSTAGLGLSLSRRGRTLRRSLIIRHGHLPQTFPSCIINAIQIPHRENRLPSASNWPNHYQSRFRGGSWMGS